MKSRKLFLQTLDSWREGLTHIKEKKAKELARRKKQQQKKKIKNFQ